MEAGQYTAAIERFSEILRRKPLNIGALSSRGRALNDLGAHAPAYVDLTRAIQLAEQTPSFAPRELAHLYHRRAYANEGLQRFEQALADADKALSLDENYVAAWTTRGVYLAHFERWHEAEDAYQRSLALDPTFLGARSNLVHTAIKLRDYALANRMCDEWATLAEQSEQDVFAGALATDSIAARMPIDPQPVRFYLNCASAKGRVGNTAEQERYWGYAASTSVRRPEDYNTRAEARSLLGELEGALRDYQAALRLQPTNTDALRGEGDMYQRLGKYDLAEQSYSAAIQVNGTDSAAYAERSSVRAQLDNLTGAAEDAQAAVSLPDPSAFAWEINGYLKARNQDLEGALQDYSKALEKDPDATRVRAARARIYERLGRSTEAQSDRRQIAGKAASVAPDHGTPVLPPLAIPPQATEEAQAGALKNLLAGSVLLLLFAAAWFGCQARYASAEKRGRSLQLAIGCVALLIMTLELLDFTAVQFGTGRSATNRNSLLSAPSRIEVLLGGPAELDRMSRAEVLEMRRWALAPYIGRLIRNYVPSEEVFGQIEDGAPWWGLHGIYFYGPGERSIEGPAEESRLLLNPLLLVGVIESAAFVTKLTPEDGETFYPAPVSLVFEGGDRARVSYRLGGYVKHMNKAASSTVGRTLTVVAYNARDFGYRYLAFDRAHLSRVTVPKPDEPIALLQFIHRGGSCGYPGGCNNMSPYQATLDILVESFPAQLEVKLWRSEPQSAAQPADLTVSLDLDL